MHGLPIEFTVEARKILQDSARNKGCPVNGHWGSQGRDLLILFFVFSPFVVVLDNDWSSMDRELYTDYVGPLTASCLQRAGSLEPIYHRPPTNRTTKAIKRLGIQSAKKINTTSYPPSS